MKKINFTLLFLVFLLPLTQFGQIPENVEARVYDLYPGIQDMYGYTVAEWNHKLIIFGGKIFNYNSEIYHNDYPNTEIILIDLQGQTAAAYSNYLFEGSIGEQLSAYGMAFHQEDSILYFLGGYAFNEATKGFKTYPFLSRMNIPLTIDALEKGHYPINSIIQIQDERIALFDAILDNNGNEFFLLDGKNGNKKNALEENPVYFEEDFKDEIRTFRIIDQHKDLQLTNFREWLNLEAFFDYYQNTAPEKINQIVRQRVQVPIN